MNEVAFVERREPDWKRLSALVDRTETAVTQLSPEELREFVQLYRKTSADLSLARTASSNYELIEFLNNLVGRAYAGLYRSPRKPVFEALHDALSMSARSVRRLRWFALASAIVFVGSAVFADMLLFYRPAARAMMVPPLVQRSFEQWKTGRFEDRNDFEAVAMTGFYSANNPLQAVKTGATAASTFGLMTVSSLYTNGLMMGALVHELRPVGRIGFLFVSITPHGVTEISGLVLAGAAGLSFGWALLCPGRRKRGDALAYAAKNALVVLATSIVMMYLAAPIEGFFSFNPHIPAWLKASFAIASAIAWGAFWIGYGREDDESDAARS